MLCILTATLAFTGSISAAPALESKSAAREIAIHMTDNKAGNCSALVEETAWNITNVVSFNANAHPHAVSYFIFDFEDTNPGLETKTQCQYSLPAGSNASLTGGDYRACVDRNIQFMWTGDQLLVERWYQDPCLGTPPYDHAIAHGRSNVSFIQTKTSDGILRTMTQLAMPITSLS